MKRLLTAALVLLASCGEPPKPSYGGLWFSGLKDVTEWDPVRGPADNPDCQGLLSLPPEESVPILVRGLTDMTPTRINDPAFDVPVVGDVCFHLLCGIAGLTPRDFEIDGVWVTKLTTNPIFAARLDQPGVRHKVQERFHKLGVERGWIPKPE